jgi:hypothetical protein
MQWNTVKTIRWVLVGIGLAAGVVLLAAGATLIGVILLVMATLRLVMLLSMQKRMRSFAAGGAPGPGPARGEGQGRASGRGQMLQRLARNELDVAATAIGIAPDELRRAVDDGRTISAVAADAGIPSRRVVDAVVRDASAKVDRAVEAGNVAPNRARMLRNRLPHWAERFVLSTPAMLAGASTRG